jgi:hypothetical protein
VTNRTKQLIHKTPADKDIRRLKVGGKLALKISPHT